MTVDPKAERWVEVGSSIAADLAAAVPEALAPILAAGQPKLVLLFLSLIHI